MLGMLGLWLAPNPFVAMGHHGGRKALDSFDVETVARGLLPGVQSWCSGAVHLVRDPLRHDDVDPRHQGARVAAARVRRETA